MIRVLTLIAIFLLPVWCFSQDVCGRWEFLGGLYGRPQYSEVQITPIGKRDVNYLITVHEKDGNVKYQQMYKWYQDTLMHLADDPFFNMKFHLNKNGVLDFYILNEKFNSFRIQSGCTNLKGPRIYHSGFFNLDTSQFTFGAPCDYPTSHLLLPFAINNKFIVKRKIDSIPISAYQARSDTSRKRLSHRLLYYFDKRGYVSRLVTTNISGTPRKLVHNYRYREDHSIEKIMITDLLDTAYTKVLLYDKDNWPVDEYGQKVMVPKKSWELADKLPHKLVVDNYHHSTSSLFYNAQHQLFKTVHTERTTILECFYKYKDGVLYEIVLWEK